MKNRQMASANLTEALRHLESFSTLSPFARLFYRHLCELIQQTPQDQLLQALTIFLRCEARRHEAISKIVRRGRVDVLRIIQVGRKSNYLLETIRQRLERMELVGREERIIRDLFLAECYYHLGYTEEVVETLDRAVNAGARHPLVHFALGYNTYLDAMQRYTHVGKKKGEMIASDPEGFISACKKAIGAFEKGLGDKSYDAQIYWWIGLIQEMIGDRRGAREAYRGAMDADPDHFGDQTMEKLEKLSQKAGPPKRTKREIARLAKLNPISEEEIARAREVLYGPDEPPFQKPKG